MIYCEEVNFLPHLPNDMIDQLSEMETYDNVFPDPSVVDTYASYVVKDRLQEWSQSLFDYPVVARWQVSKKDLPVHTDFGIVGFKYHYVLNAGGKNVKTQFWDKDHRNIIYDIVCKPNTWYNLNIDVPHNVVNITEPRIGITIRRKTEIKE